MQFINVASYPAIFLGTFVDSEVTIFALVAAAKHGVVSLPVALATVFIAAAISDNSWFAVGRLANQDLSERFSGVKKITNTRLGRFVSNHAGFITIIMRFAYGFRGIIPISVGFSGMKPIKFFILNLLSIAAWLTTVTYLSTVFNARFDPYLEKLRYFEKGSSLAILLVILIALVALGIKKQKALLSGRKKNK